MELNVKEYNQINNSFNKKLVFRIGDSAGFFSEYNNMILAIHYCLINKIRFILNSKNANFSHKNGWEDFFIPFTKEYNFSLLQVYNSRTKPSYRNKTDRYIYNLYRKIRGINYFTYNLFERIRQEQSINKIYHVDELNLHGTLLENCSAIHKMIWNYQSSVKNEIENIKSQVYIKKPYVGFHIRSGDKFTEYERLETTEYMEKYQQFSKYNNKNAFVLTDDFRVFLSLVEKYPDWNFSTLCKKNETGYIHVEFLKKSKEEQKEDLFKLLASMEILEESELFIGTYSSNPGMNMGFRMNPSKVVGVDYDKWLIW